jgi:hypothetical protein
MEAGKGTKHKKLVFPQFRKHLYTQFRFCERFGINPLKFLREDLSNEDQLLLATYEGIREHEEHEELMNSYKLQGAKI